MFNFLSIFKNNLPNIIYKMIKIEFLLLGFILLAASCSAESMPVLTYTNGLCTDSGSHNPYTRGNVALLYKDRGYVYFDSCTDERTVRKWYCDARQPEAGIYPCPLNYECSDGACFSPNASFGLAPQSTNCQDANGGGYVVTYQGEKELYVLNDTCADWFTISKAYCKNADNQSYGAYENVNCEDGLVCLGGTCIVPMPATPQQIVTEATLPPIVQVSRTLPNIESEGIEITIKLDSKIDVSRSPCAFGLSEKVPKGWHIVNISSKGTIGSYPDNGSIRLSEVVSAMNAWCEGTGSLEDVVNRTVQWRRDGVSEGTIEWVFWDPSGRLQNQEVSYTVSVPYNASLNSYFYGDYTWDGEKYRKTSGNYMMIVQRTATTTTTTTTTTIPVSRISGIAYREESGIPVPGAVVLVNCSENGAYAKKIADEHGYYTLELLCPFGSAASVVASSLQVEVCAAPDDCVIYPEEKGVGTAIIVSPGYARVDVPLFPQS